MYAHLNILPRLAYPSIYHGTELPIRQLLCDAFDRCLAIHS
nr:hypothetical protein Q903MT_gene4902 [Picea sitchensis]